jgi:hypothetical protein
MINRLVKPAYARELEQARLADESINLYAHVGATAWDRAKRTPPRNRLVVPLDENHGPADYDFSALGDLTLVLNAVDADVVLARRTADAMCKAGARLVVLLHPGLAKNSEFFYGITI